MVHVEICPNKNYRNYSVRARVATGYISSMLPKDTDPKIFKELREVAGVEEVSGHHYTVDIKKAPSFTWEEVEEGVLPLLHAFNKESGQKDDGNKVEYSIIGSSKFEVGEEENVE